METEGKSQSLTWRLKEKDSPHMETEGEKRTVLTLRLKEKDSPHTETEGESQSLTWRLKEKDVQSSHGD